MQKEIQKKLPTKAERQKRLDDMLEKATKLMESGVNQLNTPFIPSMTEVKPQRVERPTQEFVEKVNQIFDVVEGLTLNEAMNILNSVEQLIVMQTRGNMGVYMPPMHRPL